MLAGGEKYQTINAFFFCSHVMPNAEWIQYNRLNNSHSIDLVILIAAIWRYFYGVIELNGVVKLDGLPPLIVAPFHSRLVAAFFETNKF